MIMKKEIVYFDLPQLLFLFKTNLPDVVFWAETTDDSELFCSRLEAYVSDILSQKAGRNQCEAAKRLLKTLQYEGRTLCDLSTEKEIVCGTFATLWVLLRGEKPKAARPDFLIDLYFLFAQLHGREADRFTKSDLVDQANRWPTGVDDEVVAVRRRNKERIIGLLIDKIDHLKSTANKYRFDENSLFDDKYRQVEAWWGQHAFHLAMAIRDPKELNRFLDFTLSPETIEALDEAKKKKMPFFITPYYISLLSVGDEYDDAAIRSYVIYSAELVNTYGSIRAWEKEDVIEAGKPNAAGWLLPGEGNIHRRYPEVAILIPDSMGRACGGLCAPCQRMYDFQKKRLNFNLEELKPKESWGAKLARLLRYYEDDSQLRDVLITGGDALMSQNQTLKKILNAVYKMALRKRAANKLRPDGEKYAEIQRVRLGSRLLAYLPLRVNSELVDILRDFKEKAAEAGISQFIIQTHFESPLEVTPEAERAIQAILSAGWIVVNQLVFTTAASRRGHTARLRATLNRVGVVGYYTFTVKGFAENYAMFAPNSRSLQERAEEKVFGRLSIEHERQLLPALANPAGLPAFIKGFLKKNKLPFLSTDRSVLNLPGIGKSMTFSTIGVMPDGRRVLKFKHDAGRAHSPIIEHFERVYIVENKSVAAYLRQIGAMGEAVSAYATIWQYHEGTTEALFKIYEYPETDFAVTSQYTNLQIDYPDDVAI